MRKTIGFTVLSGILFAAFIAVVPARIELVVGPVEGADAAVSGWVSEAGEPRVSLDTRRTPWEGRFSAEDLEGFVQAEGAGRVRLRARMFRGPLRVAELKLEGTELSFMNRAEGLTGRAR